MKSSLPTAGRHEENLTQWDDYNTCDLPAALRQGFHPDKPGQVPEGSGQVMTAKRQL